MAIASKDCVSSVVKGHVASIHYVYDVHDEKNAWSTQELMGVVRSRCTQEELDTVCLSVALTTSNVNDKVVHHPIFGAIERKG